jgi:quinol monooxygenase YgiN
MRLLFPLMLAMTFLSAGYVDNARAQAGSPAGGAIYLVTYVDVMPNSVPGGSALLKTYRDASRKEDGNQRFEVLQEMARPNRFLVLETWKDQGALDAHVKAANTTQFRDKLKAIQNAPYDERINSGMFVGAVDTPKGNGAIFVATHVDVIPPRKDDCIAILKAMSTDTPKDAGNLRYEVLQQPNRTNHFTVTEAWKDKKSLDGHASADHTRQFREKLSSMAGALYDERFYTLM